MFRISYRFKYRQHRKYIADSTSGDRRASNDAITNFFEPLIYPPLLEIVQVLATILQPQDMV